MSLHYLGKHEPHKLGLFSHVQNDTALACYIFDTHQLILITFCRQKNHNTEFQIIISSCLAIFAQHQFINRINASAASSATAGMMVDQLSNP